MPEQTVAGARDEKTTEPRPAGLRSWRTVSWLSAEPISLVGDQIFLLALAWTAVKQAGPGGAAIVLAAAAIPRAVLMLLGGSIVDRYGAKRLALLSDAGRGALMLAAAAFAAQAGTPMLFLVVLAAMFGTVDAVFYPATGALAPLVVDTNLLVRVQNLRALGTRAALIVGAPLGGILLATGGPQRSFLVNALTFAVSTAALAVLRTKSNTRTAGVTVGLGQQILEGLRYAASQPVVRNLILLVALFEFAVNGVVNIAYPTLASEHAWGSQGFGLLLAAVGAGAATSAAALAVLPRIPAPGVLVAGSGLLGAALMATFPLADGLPANLALSFGLGAVGGVLAGIAVPMIQGNIPTEQLGRAMGLFAVATIGVAPLSLAAAAFVARYTSLSIAFLLASVLALVGGLTCLFSRQLRLSQIGAPADHS